MKKQKKNFVDGVVDSDSEPSDTREETRDPMSYLSTSPWQIMNFESEQHYKSALIEEAFELHDIVLPGSIDVYSDTKMYGYRSEEHTSELQSH